MGLFRRSKVINKPVIKQILDLIPPSLLISCVNKYKTDKGCSRYKTYDQLVALIFGQLNKCYTLSDISTGIGVSELFIKDLGLKQSPARSTMSDGNKKRDWKVFECLFYKLLDYYKRVLKRHHRTEIIEQVKGRMVKIIDSTTITVSLSMFEWAKFRRAKGGIKIHTSFDQALQVPDVINITPAKVHDRYGLKQLIFPQGSVIVEDRGYFDFELMLSRIQAGNIFVTRIKSNTVYKQVEELDLPENKDCHILKDEIIRLNSDKAKKTGINEVDLRLVHVYKEDENKVIEIITNQLTWDASTIAELYKRRWDIEIFFKSLKQNLQIKTFLGTSENAVKSQIFVAMIVYLLLELIRRTIAKNPIGFSNFVEKIRMTLVFYLPLKYVCNQVGEGAKKISPKEIPKINFPKNLFSR